MQNIVPFKGSGLRKKDQVANMFDAIAFRYDFLNRLLSFGIDMRWRKKAIRLLAKNNPQQILDIATGTGDMAIMAYNMLLPQHITGIDISEKMLEYGQVKINDAALQQYITLQQGDSETISFPDNTFDAITVAFGIRNFENLEKGLTEMLRVLKPGGHAVILEFSRPVIFPVKQLFNFYFRCITPSIGKWIAKNKTAYSYLPDSVRAFPQGEEMLAILKKNGYQLSSCIPLTFGICSIYCAFK